MISNRHLGAGATIAGTLILPDSHPVMTLRGQTAAITNRVWVMDFVRTAIQ